MRALSPRVTAVIGPLLTALALRVLAAPLGGTTDVPDWATWGALTRDGIAWTYGPPGAPSSFGYPPFAAWTLAGIDRVTTLLIGLGAPTWTPAALVKGVMWAMELVAIAYLWRTHGRRIAAPAGVALWTSGPLIVGGALLGYLDNLAAVPGLMALAALTSGRPLAAGLLTGVALMGKPQGIVLLPVLVALAWRLPPAARLRAALGVTVAGLAGITPFVVAGTFVTMLWAMARNIYDMVSGQGANLWWIATWWVEGRPTLPDIVTTADFTGGPRWPPIAVAMLLTAGVMAWTFHRAKRGANLGTGAALLTFAVHAWSYTALAIHENHLLLAVPFAGVAAALVPEYRRVAWAVTAIAALNMLVFYGLGSAAGLEPYARVAMPVLAAGLTWLTARAWPARWRGGSTMAMALAVLAALIASRDTLTAAAVRTASGVDAAIWLAAINGGVLLWHARVVSRLPGEAPAVPADSASILS